jgi:hypothetical protein
MSPAQGRTDDTFVHSRAAQPQSSAAGKTRQSYISETIFASRYTTADECTLCPHGGIQAVDMDPYISQSSIDIMADRARRDVAHRAGGSPRVDATAVRLSSLNWKAVRQTPPLQNHSREGGFRGEEDAARGWLRYVANSWIVSSEMSTQPWPARCSRIRSS